MNWGFVCERRLVGGILCFVFLLITLFFICFFHYVFSFHFFFSLRLILDEGFWADFVVVELEGYEVEVGWGRGMVFFLLFLSFFSSSCFFFPPSGLHILPSLIIRLRRLP